MDLEKKKEYARKFLEFMKDDKKIGLSIVKEDFEFKVFLKILVNKYPDEMKICIICKDRNAFNKVFNNSSDTVIVGAPYAIGTHKLYIYDVNTFYIDEIKTEYDIVIIDEFSAIKTRTAEAVLKKINNSEVEKTMVINYNSSKMPKLLNKLSPVVIDLVGDVGYLSNIIQSINKIRY